MFQEVMRKSIKICNIPYEMIMSVDIDNVEPFFAEAKCVFEPEPVNSFSAEYTMKYNRLRVSETEIANKFYKKMKRDTVKAQEENLRKEHLIDCIKEKLISWEPK